MSNIINALILTQNEGKGYNPYRNPDGTFANGPSAMNAESMSKAWKTAVGEDLPEFYSKDSGKEMAKIAGEKEWASQYMEGLAAACQTKAAALEQFIK